MKCPGCEYELWNLKAGPCPECGRPFKPSEFDFLANAIKFCCPHCSQTYYGTGAKGELVPGEFDCVSCGRHLTTDDMLLLPADALGKRDPTSAPNPWLNTHKSTSARWFAAVGASIGQPGKMMLATPAIGSTGRALSFAMANFTVAGLFGIVCAGAMLISGGMSNGSDAFFMLALVFGPAVYLFIWAAATHGLLKLFSVDTTDGMGRTVQALGFSSGAWVIGIIPCVGAFVGFPAWAMCAAVAVKAAHQTTLWRALLATLALPVLTIGGGGALMLWPMVSAPSYSSYPHSTATYTQPGIQGNWAPNTDIRLGTQRVANVLRRRIGSGNAPQHVAYLATEPGFDPMAFFEQGGGVPPSVGSSNIWLLDQMDQRSRDSVINAEVAQWPTDVTVHRLGRILLTYHGVEGLDPVAAQDIWLMVQLPIDPQGDYWAITMNGYEQIDRTIPQTFVNHQNRLRIAAGLDPLPDMATMLGSGPWTASDGVAPPP